MKAVTLIVELKRDQQYCSDDIALLKSKMPAQFDQVVHGTRTIAFVMPARDILPAMHAPLQRALSVFENYWLLGLSGEALSKNGSFDPFVSAIQQYTVSQTSTWDRPQRRQARPLRQTG